MANDLGSALFGDQDTKDKLQNQINSLQTQIDNASNVTLKQKLIPQLMALKGQLASLMQQQGVTDASGKLISAREAMPKYLDKDYLRMRENQAKDTSGLALAQSIKMGKQMQLRGQENYNPMAIAGQLENVNRTNQNQLAQDVRGESLRALQEAGMEQQRGMAYAQMLNEDDRRNIKELS